MRSLSRTFALALGFLLLAGAAEAQKSCKKGQPCGNSCISWSKTCRIGGSAPAPSADRPAASTRGVVQSGSAAADAPWVGSSKGSTYYRNGCSAARKLSAANRIYFKSEKEAEDAGYTRSRSKGC
jgi:hypothetical protein